MLILVLVVAVLAQVDTSVTTEDRQVIKVGIEKRESFGRDDIDSRARRRAAPPAAKAPTRILDVELRADPVTGQRCAYLFTIPGDPESREAIRNELRALRWVGEYGLCSNSPERPTTRRPSPPAAAAA